MGQRKSKAVITALWIGEKNPDTFSTLIQWFLSWTTMQKIKYSHNAFIFENMLWHATTPGGVRCDRPMQELKGCKVRAYKVIELDCSPEFFRGWLDHQLGKEYCQRQNLAHVIPLLKNWARNGDERYNCSEFLAAACRWSKYKFPMNVDFVLPTDTFKVIMPHVLK